MPRAVKKLLSAKERQRRVSEGLRLAWAAKKKPPKVKPTWAWFVVDRTGKVVLESGSMFNRGKYLCFPGETVRRLLISEPTKRGKR